MPEGGERVVGAVDKRTEVPRRWEKEDYPGLLSKHGRLRGVLKPLAPLHYGNSSFEEDIVYVAEYPGSTRRE